MAASKVYFADFRATTEENLLQKLVRLIRAAGMEQIDFDKKFTAIKIHFGEPGNLSFLRPNFAKAVADEVKRLNGLPFLTDANTLYVGRRKHALEHLEAAYENGYSPFSTGCHILIADGLKGGDETLVPIGLEYVKEAKIGRAIMDADIVLSLTHFKGHENTGFGGAIKNLGMGSGSRAGKMEMHSSGKPEIVPEHCVGCGRCLRMCAQGAIRVVNKKAAISDACVGCGRCVHICPHDAIACPWDETVDTLCCKMAEYAYAVVKDRPHFHIAIANNISPNCDCHTENDAAIVPDVGMFASFDPVALDMACADAVNRQPVIAGTWLDELPRTHGDHFTDAHPNTNWRVCFEHAQKIGLGAMDYELITI